MEIRGEYDLRYLDRLTAPLDQAKRREILRWFAQESEGIKIEVMRRQRMLVRRIWSDHDKEKAAEFYLACQVRAAYEIRTLLDAKFKQVALSKDEVEEIDKLSLARVQRKRKTKKSPLKNLIDRRYFLVIKKLREQEKMSWRDVSLYFKKSFKIEASFSQLRRVFVAIENERQLVGKSEGR